MKPTKEKEHGRVMLIEDDADLGTLLRDILQSDGFTVDLVNEGSDALRLIRTQRLPCLVLMDLKLRDMDGHALWEHLKEARIPERIPVYVFTAAAHVDESRFRGCAGIVRKPIDMDRLRDVLLEACCRGGNTTGAGPRRIDEGGTA